MDPDGSVGAATRGWTAQESGLDSRQGQEIFRLSITSRPVRGHTQPPAQWEPRALSPGVKRKGRQADNSLPSSVEVKNGEARPLLLHTSLLHDVVLN
jgi:hypothetical protein